MRKTDLLLQLIFILMTAGVFSLVSIKLYPSSYFAHKKEVAKQKKIEVAQKIIKKQEEEKKIIPPNRILIPAINLNLPVEPGVIVNDEWTLYEDKASWLATSQVAGAGNVIMYAHNRVHLFGDLVRVNVGDEISVVQDGQVFTYYIAEKRKVEPTDIESVLSDRSQLTLYTCEGSFDQRRLVVIAYPVFEDEKITLHSN